MRDTATMFISASPKMQELGAIKVRGGYTHLDGTTVVEDSYIITGSNYEELFEAVHNASFPQEESILEIDMGSREAWLVFKDGSEQPLGTFTKVSMGEALSSPGYTIINGEFWTAK